MKRVMQTTFAPSLENPETTGNCMAACVASIMELPIACVPNFAAAERWWDEFENWLAERGYGVVVQHGEGGWFMSPGLFAIASGKSPRGEWAHCVVVDSACCVVHDPNPSGGGLDGVAAEVWYIVPFVPETTT